MEPIDWPALIRSLVTSGLTQPQIAEACACGQSTISDLLNKRTTDPRVSLAFKLMKLAKDRGIEAPPCEVPPVASKQEARDAA